MESEGLLPLSQQPAICSYMNSIDAIPSCFFKINFNIILPSTPKSKSGVLRKLTDIYLNEFHDL
jgi:hypothetical protein